MRRLVLNPTAGAHVRRLDLKGSYVNRHGKLPRPGQRVGCSLYERPAFLTDCQATYTTSGGFHTFRMPGKNESYQRCPNSFSNCSPDIVFKDGDLGWPVHFPQVRFDELGNAPAVSAEDAPDGIRHVRRQIKRDVDFLEQQGLMDYSLLVVEQRSDGAARRQVFVSSMFVCMPMRMSTRLSIHMSICMSLRMSVHIAA